MDDFKFRSARLCTPHENLCTAIGLIQAQILANETSLKPEVMFGLSHFRNSALEAAVALLMAMSGETEDLKWLEEDEIPDTAADHAAYAAAALEVDAPRILIDPDGRSSSEVMEFCKGRA